MDGIRSKFGGAAGIATWTCALLFFGLAGTQVAGDRKAIPKAPEAEPVVIAAEDVAIRTAKASHPERLRSEAEVLRVSYEQLLDYGRGLQEIVMRASVEELEDPDGEYQRRMRQYERMWSKYQSEARKLSRRM